MRILLTTIFLAFLAQPVWATSIGELYKSCKPFANNGFEMDGLSESQKLYGLSCWSFHEGARSAAYSICKLGSSVGTSGEAKTLFATSITNTNVVVQRFINWAEDNPDEWDKPALPFIWMANTCKE